MGIVRQHIGPLRTTRGGSMHTSAAACVQGRRREG